MLLFWSAIELNFNPKNTLREQVNETFRSEIGTREVGGDNQGDKVEAYLEACGLGAGYAWCACFLTWGYDKHEVENPQSAWSPDWFKDKDTIFKRDGNKDSDKWKKADVIGIYFNSKGRIAHVGTIDEVGDKRVITIEGNTNDASSREGDQVLRKRRYKRQIYAVSRYIY